jgi:hypothetical protein
MLAVAFDTLKLARKLEGAGMAAKQAQEMAAALSDSLTEWHSVGNLATKDDILRLEANILKWLFGAIGAQTFILLAALFGLLHSVVKF